MDSKKQMGAWIKRLKTLLTGEKKVKLLLALGITGMVCILLSEFLPAGTGAEPEQQTEAFSNEGYTARLEEKVLGLVSSIEGVGKARILITLESGVEYVYASQEKKNTDVTHDYTGEEVRKLHEKDTSENSYILVDGGDGKEALVRTRMEPVVKGVVVVCEGAEDIDVQLRVLQAVTTALDLSSTQVCISKMAKNMGEDYR